MFRDFAKMRLKLSIDGKGQNSMKIAIFRFLVI